MHTHRPHSNQSLKIRCPLHLKSSLIFLYHPCRLYLLRGSSGFSLPGKTWRKKREKTQKVKRKITQQQQSKRNYTEAGSCVTWRTAWGFYFGVGFSWYCLVDWVQGEWVILIKAFWFIASGCAARLQVKSLAFPVPCCLFLYSLHDPLLIYSRMDCDMEQTHTQEAAILWLFSFETDESKIPRWIQMHTAVECS